MEIGFDMISALAQLNVAYLGISLAIIGLVVGATYLFTIAPFKESLNQQKRTLAETQDDFSQRIKDLEEKTIFQIKDHFEKKVLAVESHFQSQNDKSNSKIKDELNKIQFDIFANVDKKIDQFRNTDFESIRQQILSLTNENDSQDKEITKEISEMKRQLSSLERKFIDAKRVIMELEAHKFSQEGKMGSIYRILELIEYAINNKDDFRIAGYLNDLPKEIDGYVLTVEVFQRVIEVLNKLDQKSYYIQIDRIKKLLENVKMD